MKQIIKSQWDGVTIDGIGRHHVKNSLNERYAQQKPKCSGSIGCWADSG
ncbi:MAG: hypothetical protein MJZ31_02290 [Bacteroidales bacterium]|nr:hypothetical protein [Bacteroidales bacterium]